MYPRFLLVIALIPALLLSFRPDADASASTLSDLESLVDLVEQEDLSIDSWEVMVKEKIDSENLANITEKVTQYMGDETTVHKEDTDVMTKQVYQTTKQDGITETFTILEASHQIEVIYTIKGENDYKTEDLANIAHSHLDIFTKNATIFTCISTQVNDTIDNVYVFDTLLSNLQVETLDHIQEEDFQVVSGYSPRFETAIPHSDRAMNVQMAAREGLGGKTTITIGTPILTIEY
ncbi:YwmB family TATA-box binding protein [Aquibacillus sediminis]|uniref:YwmB family TATA-box binding protein n=1 Tax=Aquibacillus sediminis TaxID=2574734 RepID=UPI0014868AE2|nr:YwmB family TATA-box binding protein [Aquibacillus sediminis]